MSQLFSLSCKHCDVGIDFLQDSQTPQTKPQGSKKRKNYNPFTFENTMQQGANQSECDKNVINVKSDNMQESHDSKVQQKSCSQRTLPNKKRKVPVSTVQKLPSSTNIEISPKLCTRSGRQSKKKRWSPESTAPQVKKRSKVDSKISTTSGKRKKEMETVCKDNLTFQLHPEATKDDIRMINSSAMCPICLTRWEDNEADWVGCSVGDRSSASSLDEAFNAEACPIWTCTICAGPPFLKNYSAEDKPLFKSHAKKFFCYLHRT